MLKSILVVGTGIAIGMCMYKKKQKNSKSFSTDSNTDSLISKDNNCLLYTSAAADAPLPGILRICAFLTTQHNTTLCSE
ncbi:hypothetical protein, partial [Acinetobacter baumannii]|uniref:hypothetical protein n=1 Tax=Acinetobacter baumannii TaxID=470 RepID=UPI000E6A1F72